MAEVDTATIDNEQINGAFALAVDARFNSVSSGSGQKIFDLGDAGNQNNIWFGQVEGTNDIEFVVVKDGVEHSVVAENAIEDGEIATWRVGVDLEGVMRIAKNDDLLVEGQGVVPADVIRDNQLIGESSDPGDSDLDGLVLNLRTVTYSNHEELNPATDGSPCALTGEVKCFCDKLRSEADVNFGDDGATNNSEFDAEGDGEWSTPQSLGVIPIHSMVLPDGKVLSFGTDEGGKQGAQFVYSIYDPVTGLDKILENTTGVDIFCSNMSIDPKTGNIIIMGGDVRGEGGPINTAVDDIIIFDYTTQTLRPAEHGDMDYARWYGTSVTLSSDEVLILGGTGGGQNIPEVYNSETGLRTLTNAEIDIAAAYPMTWVNSDGDVIVMSTKGGIFKITTDGVGSSEQIGTTNIPIRTYSPDIMYDVDKIAVIGGDGGIYTMDIGDDAPSFTKVANATGARENGGLTVLPDGRVVISGGGNSFNGLEDAIYETEIWDPDTNEVEQVADLSTARLYHSSHLLLPNGMVWVGGGGSSGSSPIDNLNVEVYAPDYLYDENGELADRPDIVDAPTNIDSGSTFRISVDDANALEMVSAIRSGAMTHASNSDARFLELEFRVIDAATIEIDTPNANVLIPGAWMLYTVDDNGTPSVASMLGVDVPPLVDTPNILAADTLTEAYNIDDDQIDGAFEVTVEARFDDLGRGPWQRVFDFGNGAGKDNIVLGQRANSDDMAFEIHVGGRGYSIVARDAIEGGVTSKWAVSVDDHGYMRMWKDDELVAEGQGAVPADIDRLPIRIGQNHWKGQAQLDGMVRNLEIVNAGDTPEYDGYIAPRISISVLDSVLEGQEGETNTLVFTVSLSKAAQNVVSADVVISGNASGPSEVIIPAGQISAEIIVIYQGDDEFELGETVSVKLENINQATALSDVSATAEITNDDDISFGDSTYQLGTAGLSWSDANAEAEALGGKLVEINSQEENDFVNQIFGDEGTIWLGFNDVENEGEFVDSDGNALTFTNWNAGEPNNWQDNEDYVSIRGDSDRWNDLNGAAFDGAVTVIEFENEPVDDSNIVNDVSNTIQYLTGTAEQDTFVINGASRDYSWGTTQDGEGVVVWGPTGHDLLYDFENITFNDAEISLVGEGPQVAGTVNDIANTVQYLTGTSEQNTFEIDGYSNDYSWSATQDGEGIVVWGPTGHDLLYDFEKITFNDTEISLVGEGPQNGGRVNDIANTVQYLTGASLERDTFVIDGNSSEYQWGETLDGEGIVVWGATGHDLLYDFDQIEFNNETAQLDEMEM